VDLCDIPEIMNLCANWRNMSDKDLYETWNGGQGALAIVAKEDASSLIKVAKRYGFSAKIAGKIHQQGESKITIHSKYKGGVIHFY
jgi:phosphoribosylaminoimidazole (AIR) synthetase